ncbi:MAG: glutamine-hydrolyzing GMP synthase, partial [Gammaproteobacteria bacterium]|nr:glutamine-hydrolyzing GMP synthase [Gammaproteobacteria bacterium]
MAAATPDPTRQPDIHAQRVLILDFGGQYTQLIARRVREAGVYSEIFPWDVGDDEIHKFGPQGIILSGGPESAIDNSDESKTPRAPDAVFAYGVPVLGICYGMQTMAEQLGGKVTTAGHSEFGYASVQSVGESRLLRDIEDNSADDGTPLLDVWMSHGDRVDELPDGFSVIARTDNAPLAGMADEARGFYGVQFHPEVTHTKQGERILSRFLHQICGLAADWTPGNIISDSIAKIRQQVGTDQVLLGLSGGVDSSVVAAMLHQAIGDQLNCVFVDHGLMRLHEGDQVMATFAKHMGIKVSRVDAEQRFLDGLKGVTDPERKRKIIGRLFIEVFDEEAHKLDGIKWLAQGTIYPDVIESAGARTGKAQLIKSHHNVGGL